MSHLDLDTLARLVDEAPPTLEREHRDVCATCRTELDLLRGQSLALGQLPDLRPPQGDWAVLEARLMSEGLLRHERSLLAATPGWMKAAATILLFLGGTGLGMALDGGPMGAAQGGASGGPFSLAAAEPARTLDEAEAAVRFAERQYMDALVQYRQLSQQDAGVGAASPETRLAAVELLVAAGQAAVEQVPTDPVLNGFLASALAERQVNYQAVLQQGGAAGDWY